MIILEEIGSLTKPALHPWISTPEAVKAARAATRMPDLKLPYLARLAGADELYSEALIILTECALPPRDQGTVACAECGGSLERARSGAKFCGQRCSSRNRVRRHRAGGTEAGHAVIPAPPKGHIGSMWTWPADSMTRAAYYQVGYSLCNWLRTRPREYATEDMALDRAQAARGSVACDPSDVIAEWDDVCALEAFEISGVIPWHLTGFDLVLCAA